MDSVAKKFGRRYPWEKWFAQPRFTLTRGRDYDCMPHGMAAMIRNVAWSHFNTGVRVRIKEDGRIEVEKTKKHTRKNGKA